MKVKVSLAMLCVVSLLVAASVSARPAPRLTDAPANFQADPRSGYIVFSWEPLRGAEKYSVDVEGTIIWTNGAVRRKAKFEWDFGTMDGIGVTGTTDGRVFLAIPERTFARIVLAIIETEGFDRRSVVAFLLDAEARVKGLNPPPGPQNNKFSNTDDFQVLWIAP